jgi:hypothetical protein
MASSSTPIQTTRTEKMLTDLPPEIHQVILSFLDYFPLINLGRTNHSFHSLVTKDHIKNALLALELRAVREGRPLDSFREHQVEGQWTMLSTHLPCYTCLLALPTKRYFLSSQTTGKYALGRSAASTRECAGCYYKQRTTWLFESELFFAEGNTWIDCVECRKTKRFAEQSGLKWSNLAWLRGNCCFDCYWAECGNRDGEFRLVSYEMDRQKKALLEVPIQREELTRILMLQREGPIHRLTP